MINLSRLLKTMQGLYYLTGSDADHDPADALTYRIVHSPTALLTFLI